MKAMINIAMIMTMAALASSVSAAVSVTATVVGEDVAFEASGTLNLDAWTFNQTLDDFSRITPSTPVVVIGPTPAVSGDLYDNPLNYSRPDGFGAGGSSFATSGSGDLLGFRQGSGLIVPVGYVSGGTLSAMATYVGETLESLGMEVGTYTWTWGSGPSADSFTLEVSEGVPNGQSSLGEIKARFR